MERTGGGATKASSDEHDTKRLRDKRIRTSATWCISGNSEGRASNHSRMREVLAAASASTA